MRWAVFLSVLALLASAAEPACAEDPASSAPGDPRAAARASFREAQAAFARGDFAAAAAAFEQTARTAPHPATWLNAAEAWEKRGDWAHAAEDCDHALEVPDGDPEIRREAERRLAKAVAQVATLEVRGARGMGVRIDGENVQTLPLRRRLVAGAHRVVVIELETGHEREMPVDIAAGGSRTIELPAPAPPSTAETAPSSISRPPTMTWISFGVGAGLGVAAGAFGYATLDAKRDFEANPSYAALDRFHRDRLLTNVTLGAALLAAAAGVVFWVLAPAKPRSTRTGLRSMFSPGVPLVPFVPL